MKKYPCLSKNGVLERSAPCVKLDDILKYFSHFPSGDSLHEISNPVFREKQEITNFPSAEFSQRLLQVKK